MLINVKMPIVGILTFIGQINILDSKRNAYFAYLVQCINWGLNTDLIICKVSLMC